MVKILKKLNLLLDGKQKRSMVGLICMMFIGAILEAFSIAAIVPVVTVVVTPNKIQTNAITSTLYHMLHMKSETTFVIVIMATLILAFVLKNIYLYIQQKILYHFVYTNQFRTSERMMKNFMRRDYEFYMSADTAVIQRTITSDVNNMYALILSLLQLVSEVIVFAALTGICIIIDGKMTLLMGFLLIVTLLIIKAVLKPMMYKAGEENQNYYSGLFKWISQTVTGIKEVKVSGRESYFVNEYVACGKGYVGAVQKYTILNNVPRLLIETVSVAGMVAYFTYLYLSGQDSDTVLNVLAAFAMALARLMPSANRINNQLNNIAYFEPFFMGVTDNLQDEISKKNVDMSYMTVPKEKLPIRNKVEMNHITYAYPNTETLILEDAHMEIPIGSAVGIVGTTGAGKSTIVDVFLGLLNLKEGEVLADGINVLAPDNYRKWLKNVGYIPQTIFMLDDTILRNVAFGIPEKEIDMDRFWEVLKEAQLDEFVRSLPERENTGIGERGIRLSGGQRQRIGIARALYADPDILVMDEATSALDNDTEAAVMESINRLHGRKTLIIIAHRLQTIEKCDIVYRIEDRKAKRVEG